MLVYIIKYPFACKLNDPQFTQNCTIMEFHHQCLSLCGTLMLSAGLVLVFGSNIAYNSQLYWQSALPTTPMPKALLNLLQPDHGYAYGAKGNIDLRIHSHSGKNAYVEFSKDALSASDIDQGVENTFFFDTSLHEATTMKLLFPNPTNTTKLLPHQVSESIPFSTKNLSAIFSHFSLKPESLEAKAMKETLQDCEEPSVKGEEKQCATSLESMVDFAVSKLGKKNKKVEVYTSEVEIDADQEDVPKEYTIGKGTKLIGNKSVICHKLNYAYAVFYCHAIHGTKAYRVPLKHMSGVDDDDEKENANYEVAIAICHAETESWHPKHLAFQQLKVKPGTATICHFLRSDTLIFVAN